MNALLHDSHFWIGFTVGSFVGPAMAGLGVVLLIKLFWPAIRYILFWS
jgi:hypothetical protein